MVPQQEEAGMNSLTTWQDRIVWSLRFIGFCLLLVAVVRSGPMYFASGVLCLVLGSVADWLIPDKVRTPRHHKKRHRHSRAHEHA